MQARTHLDKALVGLVSSLERPLLSPTRGLIGPEKRGAGVRELLAGSEALGAHWLAEMRVLHVLAWV